MNSSFLWSMMSVVSRMPRRWFLAQRGYCALATYSAAEAIKMLRTIDVALILSDVNMPGIDGVELAMAAQEGCPRAKVLLMSGIETSETIRRRRGCEGCPFQVMAKPFDSRQLLDRVEKLID
jgi:DNA-binding response OmpR family regulator